MENVQSSESFERVMNRILYHRAQLKADGRFDGLLQQTNEMLERGRQLITQTERDNESHIEAMALRNRSDIHADRTIRGFELALQSLVMKNRKDQRYVMIFGTVQMTRMIALPIIDEVVQMRRIITLLDNPQFDGIRNPHKESLQQAADRLENAQKQLEQATKNHAITRAQLIAFRDDVTRLFRSNYGEILSAIPDSKDEVDDFFIKYGRQNSKEEEEKTPA